MKKRALITGISGQDGSNLAEHLLSLDYEVFGIIRRHSFAEGQEMRLSKVGDKVTTFYGDLLDPHSLEKVMTEVNPHEIYNLGAQSHVRVSFDVPEFTFKTNFLGVFNILEAYRKIVPSAQFYQASSSEMFGLSVDSDQAQRETTVMNPTSPYGIAKLAAYNLVRHYRRAYKLHACNGILFNHSGERRTTTFVEAKIVKTAAMIKAGLVDRLELGNLDAQRDIGASKDYVKAMHMILNHDVADDFVVATGETHSIREIVNYVFSKLELNINEHLYINTKYFRNEELPYLRGDSTKIRTTLGWKPQYTFEKLIDEMIEYWTNIYQPLPTF